MKKRVHVLYAGRVQGVGFRMTAEETAHSFGVAGWVKNLRTGQVELVAEAEEETLKRFLEAIRAGPMRNFITTAEIAWSSASETFSEFEIRYY